MRRQMSTSRSPMVAIGAKTPALLKTTSMPPKLRFTSAKKRATASGSVTSQTAASAISASDLRLSRRSWRRPQVATCQPALAKPRAAARPMPEVPPVMTMRFVMCGPVCAAVFADSVGGRDSRSTKFVPDIVDGCVADESTCTAEIPWRARIGRDRVDDDARRGPAACIGGQRAFEGLDEIAVREPHRAEPAHVAVAAVVAGAVLGIGQAVAADGAWVVLPRLAPADAQRHPGKPAARPRSRRQQRPLAHELGGGVGRVRAVAAGEVEARARPGRQLRRQFARAKLVLLVAAHH